MMKKACTFCWMMCLIATASLAQNIVEQVDLDEIKFVKGKKQIAFSQSDFQQQIKSKSKEVLLPYLGTELSFEVLPFSIYGDIESPFPEIKTYKIYAADGRSISGRITDGPAGTFISYLHLGQIIRIFPDLNQKEVYYEEVGINHDHHEHGHVCNANGKYNYGVPELTIEEKGAYKRNGSTKRIYRTAIVCTGEYYNANGGNTSSVRQTAIANLNDISAIFEKDISAELFMAQGAPRIFNDPNTDPFIPDNSGGAGRTTQAQDAIENLFATSRYDVGHVFHRHTSGDGWSSGGVAGLGVVCNDNRKASGWSGSGNNTSNGWIQLACHEFGHQFNATHTFNGTGGSCTDNISSGTSFEIGSGTTIMSYQGICEGSQNIAGSGVADNYFHVNSLDRMIAYMEQFGNCNEVDWINDNNNPPVVNANPCGATYQLPRRTPFFLTGDATDADGDEITYCWEGYDEDGQGTPTQGLIGIAAAGTTNAPLWRSFPPTLSPTRYFPNKENVKDNITSDFEVLPNRARGMRMRLTARDNNPVGGGVDWEQIVINAESTMGPLEVTGPSIGSTVQAGESTTVTWNPRNSESMCANAAIRLSLDGGLTFPFTLADEVDYSLGTFDVMIPASFSNSNEARIMVACDDYDCFQWYDMMNGNFNLESDCFASASTVCDEEYEEFEFGDAALMLDLQPIVGNVTTELSGTVENVPPTMPVAVNDFNSNCTRIVSANNAFDTINFSVTESGPYTFIFNTNLASHIKAYTIFDAETFDSGNACPSFIESNAQIIGNSFTFTTIDGGNTSQMTVNLDACRQYLLAAQISSGMTITYSVADIIGPGDFLARTYNNDYALTYIAVDSTDEIKFVTNNADFTTLEAGNYDIYCANYKSSGPAPPDDVNPSNWIGITTDELLNSGDCYRLSSNYKPISIISTCTVFDLELLNQSPCDPIDNTYSQTIKFKIDKGPGSGTVEINGQMFTTEADSMEVTLTGLIADGQPVDLAFAFSDDVSCNRILDDIFIAPENCCPINIDFGGDLLMECEGNAVTLNAGPDGTTYEWSLDGNPLAVSDAEIQADQSGNYDVIVTDVNGCAKPANVEVQINPVPSIDVFNDLGGCTGDTFQIDPDTDADSIEWYQDGALISTDFVLDISESGEYVALVRNEFDCTASDTVTVDLIDSPVVDLGEDQVLCEGDTLILNGGDPAHSYVWTLDGIDQMNDSNTLDAVVTGVYIVVATNGFDCSTSDTVTLEFNPLPDLDIGMDQDRCEDDIYTIVATTNGFDIEWYLNGTRLMGEDQLEVTALQSGTYLTRIYSGVDCFTETSINVNYNPLPDFDIGGDQSACEGQTITFDAGQTGLEYVWSLNGTIVQESEEPTLDVTMDGEVIVVATNSFACVSADTASASFIQMPMIDIGDDFDFCEGDQMTIQANANVSNATWFKDGVEIIGETGTTLTVMESGEYVAVVGTGGLCEDRDTLMASAIAAPDFTITGKNEECEGQAVQMLVNLDSGETIEWFLDGDIITGETASFLIVEEPGLYSALVTNTTGCQTEIDHSVEFFPDPTNMIPSIPDLCEGDVFTTVIQTDGVTFEWEDDNGTIIGATDPQLDITESGTYTFTSYNAIGCSSTNLFLVNFDAIPSSDIGSDQSACDGDMLELSADDQNDVDYEWSLDGNPIPGETGNSLSATTSGMYGLLVTSDQNCTSYSEVMLTFNLIPTLDFNDAASYCEGTSVDLDITTDASNIEWTLNGSNQGQDVQSITASQPGNYNIEVTSDQGCTISGTISVTELANPTVNVDDVELCPGESQDINLDNSFVDYVWTGLMATGSSATVDYQEFPQITSEDASVMVTDVNNCSTTEEFTVTYFPPINAMVQDNDVSLCEGQTVTLQAGGGLFYEWSDPNGSLSATDISNPVASPTETTNYSVTISDNCPNNVATLDVMVTINTPPIANAGRDTCILVGQVFELNASGGAFYSWNNQDKIVGSSNIANPRIEIDSATIFTVTVTDENGCQDTDDVSICIIDDPTSIFDAVTILTPNGDGKNDELVFKGLEAFPDNKLTIFNRWGNVIYEKVGYQRDDQRWSGLRDGQELPADTYYYVLEFADLNVKTSLTIIRE